MFCFAPKLASYCIRKLRQVRDEPFTLGGSCHLRSPYLVPDEIRSITGGRGADTIHSGDGSDTASYSSSTNGVRVNLSTNVNSGGDAQGDKLSQIENLSGSNRGDTLTGDSRTNVLHGHGGNDTLNGLDDNDRLISDGGRFANMFGGKGNLTARTAPRRG